MEPTPSPRAGRYFPPAKPCQLAAWCRLSEATPRSFCSIFGLGQWRMEESWRLPTVHRSETHLFRRLRPAEGQLSEPAAGLGQENRLVSVRAARTGITPAHQSAILLWGRRSIRRGSDPSATAGNGRTPSAWSLRRNARCPRRRPRRLPPAPRVRATRPPPAGGAVAPDARAPSRLR